jgi:hypothetical protein
MSDEATDLTGPGPEGSSRLGPSVLVRVTVIGTRTRPIVHPSIAQGLRALAKWAPAHSDTSLAEGMFALARRDWRPS